MPCYAGREKEDNERHYRADCILCAVIRTHGIQVLLGLDYKTMGLTPAQVMEWAAWHHDKDNTKYSPKSAI